MAADVAGYSRLIGADEEGTLNRSKAIRAELIDPSGPHRQDHRRRLAAALTTDRSESSWLRFRWRA
jgi:hypothetical protein